MTKRISWPLLLLLLTACAGPQAKQDQVAAATVAAVASQANAELRSAASALPGAVVAAGEALTIGYPGPALFSEGSAVPLAGGIAVLDPLAALLASHGSSRWQGTVRAASGVSPEYDQQLAATRVELLGRYFSQRGIAADRLVLRAEAGSGPSLELLLQD